MIRLDAATFLLQWAVGGLFFTWVTTRRREVGLGYGWLMRGVFGAMALASELVAQAIGPVPVRDGAAVGVALAATAALVVSVRRKAAGVAGQRETVERRSARVAAMTGIDRDEQRFDKAAAEFPPVLDLVAPLIGVVGLVAGGVDAGSPAVFRPSLRVDDSPPGLRRGTDISEAHPSGGETQPGGIVRMRRILDSRPRAT